MRFNELGFTIMNWLRQHWFELGLGLALAASIYLCVTPLSPVALALWLNLIALFLHQFEEYRYPGYFPGMMNSVMFASQAPDHYPLNTNSALLINVALGWAAYWLAAVFGAQFIWLGIAAIFVSCGNVLAHTFLFNLKGKTVYNPGMATALILFLPLALYFFFLLWQNQTATWFDWLGGIGLGLALTYFGIFKLIDWLKDKHTPYIFPPRCLPPAPRKK